MIRLKKLAPWVAGLLVVLSLALVSTFTMSQGNETAYIAYLCRNLPEAAEYTPAAAIDQAACMACLRGVADGQACEVLAELIGTTDH